MEFIKTLQSMKTFYIYLARYKGCYKLWMKTHRELITSVIQPQSQVECKIRNTKTYQSRPQKAALHSSEHKILNQFELIKDKGKTKKLDCLSSHF